MGVTDSLHPHGLSTRPAPLPLNSLAALTRSHGPSYRSAPRIRYLEKSDAARPALGRYVAVALCASVVALAVTAEPASAVVSPKVEPKVLHGAPVVKKSLDGLDVRWRKGETTVYIDASVDSLAPGAREAVQLAFGAWMEGDARLPKLVFDSTRGTSTQAKPDGKNTVTVAAITLAGHENDLAITLTYSDERSGSIIESDIVINSRYAYKVVGPISEGPGKDKDDEGKDQDAEGKSDPPLKGEQGGGSIVPSNGQSQGAEATAEPTRSSCMAQSSSSWCGKDVYDIQNVLTHEVGHFLGLGEDYDDTAASMYVCTNRCETHKRALSSVDTSTINELYAAPMAADERPAQAGGCNVQPSTPGRSSGLALLGSIGAALLMVGRRRSARAG